ncbi:alpha/beta fold hydrolase [Streptomyces cyaneofuscatus]|uniref:thioesterase II family protein n=1 Tax=Streptomyces cyaneofuscatus TaxID=66883 RepID=UPI002952E14C|nr:alpha/beta fold hydrolase [Streptomyces cyaneofuscatus]WOP07031.1 alpha/beta fold hydrolase [Streptomyces cyaneofuscatus]
MSWVPAGNPAPSPATQWLRRLDFSSAADTTRLVCFPHAGGGASAFLSWLPHLPPAWELWAVEYPGRENRAAEPPPTDLRAMARDTAYALQWIGDRPYALFGHSMGAIVAYETSSELLRIGGTAPQHLFLSGSLSPQHAGARAQAEWDSAGSDVQWLGEETCSGDASEQRTLATETLESDLRMLTAYREPPTAKITVAVSVLFGAEDPHLDAAGAAGWNAYTVAPADVMQIPGDHFSCFRRPNHVLTLLNGVFP